MNNDLSPAPSSTRLLGKLGRLLRFMAFVCTSGWLFPHACTEGMDLTRIQNEQTGKRT